MSETEELTNLVEDLKVKLVRAERQLAGLKEKGKYLRMQYDDARTREQNTNELVMELLERQRELNVMLNRANIMLNRTQEAMALTSIEFNEMAKALPEPKKAEWSDRVARINELFKKTGIQDAELVEPDDVFGRKQSIPDSGGRPEPPRVEAVPVEDAPPAGAAGDEPAEEILMVSEDQPVEDSLVFPPRRKSWWRRAAG